MFISALYYTTQPILDAIPLPQESFPMPVDSTNHYATSHAGHLTSAGGGILRSHLEPPGAVGTTIDIKFLHTKQLIM